MNAWNKENNLVYVNFSIIQRQAIIALFDKNRYIFKIIIKVHSAITWHARLSIHGTLFRFRTKSFQNNWWCSWIRSHSELIHGKTFTEHDLAWNECEAIEVNERIWWEYPWAEYLWWGQLVTNTSTPDSMGYFVDSWYSNQFIPYDDVRPDTRWREMFRSFQAGRSNQSKQLVSSTIRWVPLIFQLFHRWNKVHTS